MPKLNSELKKRITSKDPREREAAVSELGNHADSESLGYLKEMLFDESSNVVHSAVRDLVSRGSREVVEAIIPLLGSDNARLRNLAAEILVKIGDVAIPQVTSLINERDRDIRKFGVDILKGLGGLEVEDPLIRSLYDDDNNVAMAAAEALGSLGVKRAVPHLIECVGKEPWLRYAVLKSLGEIGGKSAVDAILAIDPEEESIVLFHAVTALGTIGDKRGLDFLIRLLEKKDPTLLPSIIQAIERIVRDNDDTAVEKAKGKIPVSAILSLLRSDSTDTVRCAIGLLGLFKEEKAIGELVRLYTELNEHLFDDLEKAFIRIRPERVEPFIGIIENKTEPETVKIATVRLLGRMGRKDTFDPLLSCMGTTTAPLKKEIIQTLAALKDRRILTVLHSLFEDEQPEIKETAIEILETYRDDSSIPLLMKLSTDPSESVRSLAATSLRGYNLEEYREGISDLLSASRPERVCFGLGMIPEGLSYEFNKDIFALCNHKDEAVRKHGVEKCSLLKEDMAFEIVSKSVSDERPQVRLAGVRGLGNYRDRDVGPLLLYVATSDPEEWIRYEAVKIMGKMSPLGLAPDLISLLETAPDLVRTAILDVLGELGDREYGEIIKKYTTSGNEQLRDAAVEALDQLK